MVVWLEIEAWVIGKSGAKTGIRKCGEVGGGRDMGAAVFCGSCVCLVVFLM
jgi:hypothetical protein